ncbi:MAG: hypothetical protein GWP47_15125 [Actinobacteria bacterium]|nr:hypothetical protein [Actinomycetota bacterium]
MYWPAVDAPAALASYAPFAAVLAMARAIRSALALVRDRVEPVPSAG